MAAHAPGHVRHKVKEVLDLDIDRPMEIHMVRLIPERDDRHEEDVARGALSGRFADRPDEKVVYIQRKVRTVVLDRPDRQNHHGLLPGNRAQLGPRVVLIEIFFARHHYILSRRVLDSPGMILVVGIEHARSFERLGLIFRPLAVRVERARPLHPFTLAGIFAGR